MDIREDLVVVRPCRGGEVDWLIGTSWVEFGKKKGTKMNGSSAGNGLKADDPLLLYRWAVGSEY